jgi:hypothetical protein
VVLALDTGEHCQAMTPTRKRRWTAILISSAAIAAVTGCGSSSSSSSSTSVAKAPQATPLSSRTLTAGELPGFAPVGARSFQTDARLWLIANQVPPNQLRAQTAWLHKLAFIGGAREDLANQRAGGLSLVEQFHSFGAARKELAMHVREFKTGIPRGQASSFAVTGSRAPSGSASRPPTRPD